MVCTRWRIFVAEEVMNLMDTMRVPQKKYWLMFMSETPSQKKMY